MWAGLSSVASSASNAVSNATGVGGGGDSGTGGHHHHQKQRRTRSRVQQNGQDFSNRSSPEPSPERTRLKPFTSVVSSSATNVNLNPPQTRNRTRSPAPSAQSSSTTYATSGGVGGEGQAGHGQQQQHYQSYSSETPGTERGAYFGSNESDRYGSYNDEDGDASSSEDSGTELLDEALGIRQLQQQRSYERTLNSQQSSTNNEITDATMSDGMSSGVGNGSASATATATATATGGGGTTAARRELLVQRRQPEPSQHFGVAWDQWEQALLKPRRSPVPRRDSPGASSGSQHLLQAHNANTTGSPRKSRSLTPKVDGGHLHSSKRRASPTKMHGIAQDIAALSSGTNRSPTPSAPASPQGQIPCKSRIPFRGDLLPEVAILTAALVLTAYRLASLPTPLDANLEPLTPIPLSPFVILVIAIPCTALFRHKNWQSNYMFPFTDERGYRTPATVDDGFAAGATVPILLAAGFLWDAVSRGQEGTGYLSSMRPLMEVWDAAGKGPSSTTAGATLSTHSDFGAVYRTIIVSRISLLLSTSINSFVLILNIVLSRTFLSVDKLTKDNTRRLLGSFIVSSTISLFLWTLLALNDAFAWASPYISPAEAAVSSFIYQMSLYIVSRLVRRGFTLGELSLATGAGISLALEFWRLSSARLFYSRTGAIPPTFRMPTPLVPYQHVMIPGAFITGFLLSPLLVLSRQFAQMPSHRLRRPGERGRNRKLIALGVGLGMIFVMCVPFGGWAGWALGGNLWTAWTWPARFSIYGGNGVEGMHGEFSGWKRWKRFTLAMYWLGIVTVAVGGWQTRLVRARRIRVARNRSLAKTSETGPVTANPTALGVAGISELREDRRMHVALDLRRKFFHALAVLMFIPAIAIDPAFTSLAFSAAFAIFTFAEYARYFAVYPIGAPIHIFFNEFIDSKDAGPVILSHFYLLTGCAGGLWLEGKGIKNFTGVLSVGIGDAFASVLGKRLGSTKWPNTNKTILGTIAFIMSVFGSAMLLRITGLAEPFSATRYLIATIFAGILEALSAQNDNLVIPIFFWSLLSLLEV